MIVRVRTNVGTWKMKVADGASVATLLTEIQAAHSTSVTQLFRDPALSQSIDSSSVLSHGDLVFASADESTAQAKHLERKILPDGSIKMVPAAPKNGFRKDQLALRDMKLHWNLNDFVELDSKFEFKMERQKESVCGAVSLDTAAIQQFQQYAQQNFFSKRIGFLYGSIVEPKEKDERPTLQVEAIYEPPQQVAPQTPEGFEFDEDNVEMVDAVAQQLGLQKVGLIFCHPKRDAVLTSGELILTAELQLEAAQGIHETPFSIVKVFPKANGQVHVEAFQVSQQCMAMVAEEALLPESDTETRVHDTFTAIQEGKPSKTIENSFFLCVVPIRSHKSSSWISDFGFLNRASSVSRHNLQSTLSKSGRNGWTLIQRLTDLNALLFLQSQLDAPDFAAVCQCVAAQSDLAEGHQLMIKSLAGLEGSY